jgi:hypothetical protein
MNDLNIQVGNLWYVSTPPWAVKWFDVMFVVSSFLPQDKVSEFAHMSPQQLLRETQRAAGDPRLTNWHDTLIAAGKEMTQLTEASTLLAI